MVEKIIEIQNNNKKLKNNIPKRIIIHNDTSFQEVYAKATVESINIILNPN